MLDDLKLINTRDAEDALGIAEKQWQQYTHNFNFSWSERGPINNVVFVGMGGSGLSAKVYKNWPGVNLPFEIVQDYDLPRYVNKETLLIVSSYSGNTEEEVSIINQAIDSSKSDEKKPQLIVITSGGKLKEIAEANRLPLIVLPSGFQPRFTLGYQLRALCEVMEAVGLGRGNIVELEAAANWLKDKLVEWIPTVPTSKNPTKQLAQDIIGKSVVIYSSSKLSAVAYKWKISFNENAKSIAWWNQFPEFNHNEFLGWTNLPVEKPYCVVDLRSSLDIDHVKKRFEISAQLLSGKRPSPEVINLEGESLIQQLIWGIGFGDFVSLYTAILSGIDPSPVKLIEEFKFKLNN